MVTATSSTTWDALNHEIDALLASERSTERSPARHAKHEFAEVVIPLTAHKPWAHIRHKRSEPERLAMHRRAALRHHNRPWWRLYRLATRIRRRSRFRWRHAFAVSSAGDLPATAWC